MNKILVVDHRDNINLSWFREQCGYSPDTEVVLISDSQTACFTLGIEKFDCVFVNSEVEDIDSGINVVNHITNLLHTDSVNVPSSVIIHSVDGKVSREMEMILIRNGYPIHKVLRRPYFEKQKLIDFIKMRATFNEKV